MNSNNYSRFRYSNNLHIKVRADANGRIVDVFGADLRPISDNIKLRLLGSLAPPYGTVVIMNYIYAVERITNTDISIVPSSYIKPTYLKPF